MIRFILASLIFFISFPAMASDAPSAFRSTAYPLPRFVSLRSDKVYVRTGPGARYPVKWVFEKAGLPVEIILEYENWRKIKDFSGDEGWIHQSLLSGRRTALSIADGGVSMYKKQSQNSALIVVFNSNSLLALDSCGVQWCMAEMKNYKGWIQKSSLWGVYAHEKFD